MPRTTFGGTSDNTRVDRSYYERPSLAQDGPLHTIPLDLPRDQFEPQFFGSIQQQANSFRSESLPRDKFERTSFPQQAPLFAFRLDLLFEAKDIPAITQLSDSYRLRSTLPLDKFQRTDFAHAPPQWTIPLDLPRGFDPVNQPAFSQLSNSFRSFESLPKDKFQRTDFAQQVPSFRIALDLFEIPFWPAIEQETKSFRVRESLPTDKFQRTDYPQGTPLLTIPLDLPRDLGAPEFCSAIEQLVRSYRVSEGEKLQLSLYTWIQTGWIFTGFEARTRQSYGGTSDATRINFRQFERPSLPQDGWLSVGAAFNVTHWPALEQAIGSFRVRESLPTDKFQRTDFAQTGPLLTIPLDLARDIFDPAFIPAIYQLLHSFRARDIEPVIPKLRPEFYSVFQTGWAQIPTVVAGAGGANQDQFRDTRRR